MLSMKSLLCLICLGIQMGLVCGSGKLEIIFLSFTNEYGLDSAGNNCDPTSSSCEHNFQLCVNLKPKIPSGMSDCSQNGYKAMKSTGYINGNVLKFKRDQDFGNGFKNPMLFSFKTWKGGFGARLKVMDRDYVSSNDFVDTLLFDQQISSLKSKEKTNYQLHTITGTRQISKTTATMEIKAYCDQNYYSSDCSVFCKETSTYTCNKTSGENICKSNWYGEKCNLLCVPQNGTSGHYDCDGNGTRLCHTNWYGKDCNRYCQAQDTKQGHYNCSNDGKIVCHDDWYGIYCNGTCQSLNVTIKHYNCTDEGRMICHQDWYGTQCDVHCLSQNNTLNGFYTCGKEGQRICYTNWYGQNCTSYCQSQKGIYKCGKEGRRICTNGLTGFNCTIPLTTIPATTQRNVESTPTITRKEFSTTVGPIRATTEDPVKPTTQDVLINSSAPGPKAASVSIQNWLIKSTSGWIVLGVCGLLLIVAIVFSVIYINQWQRRKAKPVLTSHNSVLNPYCNGWNSPKEKVVAEEMAEMRSCEINEYEYDTPSKLKREKAGDQATTSNQLYDVPKNHIISDAGHENEGFSCENPLYGIS